MAADSPRPVIGGLFGRRLLVGLLLALLFTWLALRPQPVHEHDARLLEREFLAMGTLVSVSVYLDADYDRDRAQAVLAGLERFLLDFEQRWAAWGTGALGALNNELAAGHAAAIAPPLQALFAEAARLSEQSAGSFDPRVGNLVRLWGFDDESRFRSSPPSEDEVLQAVADLQAAPLLTDGAHSYGPAAAVRLDFGAIAKGYAIDLALAQLREAGIADAIVNAGGNLRAAGRHGERAWRVGIRHPRPDDKHRILATLDTQGDEAIITSGDYERYFESQGRRYHHLLDPRSGYPAGGLQSVTIVHPSGTLADAASTALFVAGADWRAMAQRLGLTQVLVVDARGRVFVTPQLAPRLDFSRGIRAETVP